MTGKSFGSGTDENPVYLISTSFYDVWNLNLTNSATLSYLAVASCNASGGAYLAAGNSADLGGNSNCILFNVEIDTPASFPAYVAVDGNLSLEATGSPGCGTYSWTATGPGTVIFSPSPTVKDPTFKANVAGTYTVKVEYTKYGTTSDDTSGNIVVFGVEKVFVLSNASGSWSDDATPTEAAHDTDVDLRAIIKVNPAIQAHYYFWGFTQGTATVDGQSRTVYQWNNDWGTPTFDWNKVEPIYYAYENTWFLGILTSWAHLFYEENDKSTTAWELQDVGGSGDVGVMRYTIDVTLETQTVESPDTDDNHGANDYCIDDTVMRIIVKGNYTPSILKWGGAYINVPFILGSEWEHQVKDRYIGVDCADLIGRCLQRCSSSIPDDPSAHDLYGYADNEQHGLDIVTDRTLDSDTGHSVPQPNPGDIVLFDWNGDGTYQHSTLFVSGPGDCAICLDPGDSTIYASSGTYKKVVDEDYTNMAYENAYVAVIRYSP